jgi:hypothetical protein
LQHSALTTTIQRAPNQLLNINLEDDDKLKDPGKDGKIKTILSFEEGGVKQLSLVYA